MRKSNPDILLTERLEELWALREAAASLERLRGVIHTRFYQHPNADLLCTHCHQAASQYMAQFDRAMIALLNMAAIDMPKEDDSDA